MSDDIFRLNIALCHVLISQDILLIFKSQIESIDDRKYVKDDDGQGSIFCSRVH